MPITITNKMAEQEKLKAKYIGLIEAVISEYKDRVFYHLPQVSSEDADLRLVGREGLKLKFVDSRDKLAYLSLDEFFELAQSSSKCKDSRLDSLPYIPEPTPDREEAARAVLLDEWD